MGPNKGLTSFDRVAQAMRLREPDRVPVVVTATALESRYAGYKFSECLASVEKLAGSVMRLTEDFGLDAAFSVSISDAIPEALGCELTTFEDDVPAVSGPILRSSQDLEKLPTGDITGRGRLPFLLEGVRRLKEAVGPDLPVIAWTSLPFRTASRIRGMQNLYRDLVVNPQFVKELMEYCLGPGTAYGQALLEAGADIIFVTNPVASAFCISRKHYEEFVFPYSRRMLTTLKKRGAKVLFHVCGDWSDRLDLVCEEGVDVLHIDSVENMDLGKVKAQLGARVCLMGNVRSVATMLQGTPGEVERETKDCIANGAPGGGFILSADCGLPRDTPAENLRAMVDAARRYGEYPLRLN